MTIDEAIEHAEERACGNDQCAKDHAQLADWLRELRRARMKIDLLKTLRDGFKADAQKYKAENAKLRDFAKSYLAAAGVDCGICPYCDPDLCDTETDPMRDGCRLWEEMRKLGVEVEE